jgi:hypothetical protein
LAPAPASGIDEIGQVDRGGIQPAEECPARELSLSRPQTGYLKAPEQRRVTARPPYLQLEHVLAGEACCRNHRIELSITRFRIVRRGQPGAEPAAWPVGQRHQPRRTRKRTSAVRPALVLSRRKDGVGSTTS